MLKIRNPPFDKLVDTNCGWTIVESQRNVSGFLPTAGEETAFFSEHPVPPCSHQTNWGQIVQLVINHLKYILFELYCSCLRVYAFSLYLLKPFCTVEPALCKHITSWRYNVRARQPDSSASTGTSHAECTPPPGNRHLRVYSFNRRWEPIAFKIRQKYSHFFWKMHMYSQF